MDYDVHTRNVASVVAVLSILMNTATAVFLWKRLQSDKLMLRAVMLSPCISITLIAIGAVALLFGASAALGVASWVLIGAGMLAIPSSMVLLLIGWLKRRAQHS